MSIRTRLIITHIAVIVLTLVIMAASLVFILRSYQTNVQLARLGDAAVPLAFQARALFLGNAAPKEVITRLQPQANSVGDLIVLTDKGLVLADNTYGLTNRSLAVAQLNRPGATPGFVWGTLQQKQQNRTLLYVAVAAGQANGQTVYIGLIAREQSFFSVLDEIGVSLLIAGGITLIISLLVAVLLARSIAKPITRLTQATEAIARGQYDHRVEGKGNDEIGRLGTSFNAMATQVERARKMEKDFVADVSHELKTPLTSIQGFSQAIVDGAVADLEGARRAAQTIFDEAERMARLVADLLTLARLESGQMPLAQDQINLTDLLPHWIERLRPRAVECSETLNALIDPLPILIGDTRRLEQVFTNLIENAIKYNHPEGTVTVTAKTITESLAKRKLGAKHKAWIEIEVKDTGEGIAPEELPRLFDRFYRGDKARVAGGTGLGLSIAKEIVVAHGGTLTAMSELGHGSTFTVMLPINNL